MKSGVALLALLLLVAPACSVGASGTRTEEKPYLASGDTLWWCDLGSQERNVGGACFRLDGTETSVHVTLQDEHAPVVAGYFQVIRYGVITSSYEGSFCGEKTLNLHGGNELRISVYSSGELWCAGSQPATKGTIHAEFTFDDAPAAGDLAFEMTAAGCAQTVSLLGCEVRGAGSIALDGACSDANCPISAIGTAYGATTQDAILILKTGVRQTIRTGFGTIYSGQDVCDWEEDLAHDVACTGNLRAFKILVHAGECRGFTLDVA
jgi:hypothetical protein